VHLTGTTITKFYMKQKNDYNKHSSLDKCNTEEWCRERHTNQTYITYSLIYSLTVTISAECDNVLTLNQ